MRQVFQGHWYLDGTRSLLGNFFRPENDWSHLESVMRFLQARPRCPEPGASANNSGADHGQVGVSWKRDGERLLINELKVDRTIVFVHSRLSVSRNKPSDATDLLRVR